MPRLSLWRENHSNDYKFFDRRISEEFTIGGTGVYLHKYLGPTSQVQAYNTTATVTANSNVLPFGNVSAMAVGQTVSGIGIASGTVVTNVNFGANTVTINNPITSTISSNSPVSIYWNNPEKPAYQNQSATNIQDLLFVENRDRKYDTSIYSLRGIYTVNDNDFDLQQFGIFLSADTVMMTFHLNDVVTTVGRKLMSGDVLELLHKKDYYPLDAAIPAVLKRYYVIQDVTFAAEGFSATWWPHLVRVKMTPLVDAQEYKDILNNVTAGDAANTPIGQILSNYNKLNEINDAVLAQAQIDVPLSGYNTDTLYVEPTLPDGSPGDPTGQTVDFTNLYVDSNVDYVNTLPYRPAQNTPGYLTTDSQPPNGFVANVSTSFPTDPSFPAANTSIGQYTKFSPEDLAIISNTQFPPLPQIGDYILRVDFLPNRLFRWDGARWVVVQDVVRANLTPGADNKTLTSTFINDTSTYTNKEGQTLPTRQNLNQALTPRADN